MNGKAGLPGDTVYDYIVIGSGFGGSVSAMRLAQKGYTVLVLEKGRRYRDEDFPKSNWNLKKYLWMPFLRWTGFLKLTAFKKLFVVSGVGVGGGSLVYANTLLEPPDPFFENIPLQTRDWKKVLQPFFHTARKMLGVTPARNQNPDDLLLREIARDMGREETFKGVDVGVYYNEDLTPRDPYFNGEGPLRSPCIECAGCMVGCRHNAKNTLEKNYLWFAEKYGAKILPLTQAERIEWNPGNSTYSIHVRSPFNKRITGAFQSRGIILSGGVLGTLELLFRQKFRYGTLSGLSEQLGRHILSNSESICGVIGADRKLNYGVAISSIMQADSETQIELCKFPDGSGSLFRLAFLTAHGGGPPMVRSLKILAKIFLRPLDTLKWIIRGQDSRRGVVILVMQHIKNALAMRWTGRGMKLESDGEEKPIPVFIPAGYEFMQRLAKKTRGVPVSAVTETFFNMSTTAHFLGGCPMGANVNEGVVDDVFRVHGYPGMYILDGSIIPVNIGVNPSLTITALAEYAMDQIPVKSD